MASNMLFVLLRNICWDILCQRLTWKIRTWIWRFCRDCWKTTSCTCDTRSRSGRQLKAGWKETRTHEKCILTNWLRVSESDFSLKPSFEKRHALILLFVVFWTNFFFLNTQIMNSELISSSPKAKIHIQLAKKTVQEWSECGNEEDEPPYEARKRIPHQTLVVVGGFHAEDPQNATPVSHLECYNVNSNCWAVVNFGAFANYINLKINLFHSWIKTGIFLGQEAIFQ